MGGPAIGAWEAGGRCWKAWNSRLVSAALRGMIAVMSCTCMFSCYAPAYVSSREERNKLFNTLSQQCLQRNTTSWLGTSMPILGLEWMMIRSGGMKGIHMGMELSMRLAESCCPPQHQWGHWLYVTPGLQRRIFIYRLGNTQSLNSDTALIMPSWDRHIAGGIWMSLWGVRLSVTQTIVEGEATDWEKDLQK